MRTPGEPMYDLPYHKERDEQVVKEFIDEHPFAFLTGCDPEGRPVATQVPVFMDERDGRIRLRGHIMRNTDHHRAFVENDDVLVVFSGSHAYVSGTWYRDPHTPSTWNYMSVHARGTIRFLDGDALEEMLRRTSLHFEDHDQESPTVYDNLPAGLVKKLKRAIVAFEIVVTAMDNVFKLSQDRDRESYLNIIEELKDQGGDGAKIAAEMERRIGQVFPEERGA